MFAVKPPWRINNLFNKNKLLISIRRGSILFLNTFEMKLRRVYSISFKLKKKSNFFHNFDLWDFVYVIVKELKIAWDQVRPLRWTVDYIWHLKGFKNISIRLLWSTVFSLDPLHLWDAQWDAFYFYSMIKWIIL